MVLLKVYGLLPNLEVNGERVALVEFDAECLGDSGDCFCNVIARFYGIANNLKLVVRDVDMKHDYAFVVAYRWDYGIWISLVLFLPLYFYSQEFSDPRDTDDARYGLNGREFDGSRIIVEFAKGVSVVNYMLCLFLLNSSTRSILDWRKVVFDSCGFLWRPHSHKK
ncbi:hypothetical protein HYC85_006718 [Camellia sinensis]|uniref:Uncharacterized protein n=1 Tax=Camellia sinensis TaxID=4442 RepID=A0A7J7HLV2_CAMSI|nr:hypothetical protein HYC85_006718 [Camellia sinensis]